MTNIQKKRDSAPYSTNLVIPKVNLDENGVQNPSLTDIALAKERVDNNEK